jgi:hypothetical protein
MLRLLGSSPTAQFCSRLRSRPPVSRRPGCRMLHHLMVGTWTPPGAIFTFEFDDENLTLKLIKRTPIPEKEPISWMTFDVSSVCDLESSADPHVPAYKEEHLWSSDEEMVQFCCEEPNRNHPSSIASYGTRACVSSSPLLRLKLTFHSTSIKSRYQHASHFCLSCQEPSLQCIRQPIL